MCTFTWVQRVLWFVYLVFSEFCESWCCFCPHCYFHVRIYDMWISFSLYSIFTIKPSKKCNKSFKTFTLYWWDYLDARSLYIHWWFWGIRNCFGSDNDNALKAAWTLSTKSWCMHDFTMGKTSDNLRPLAVGADSTKWIHLFSEGSVHWYPLSRRMIGLCPLCYAEWTQPTLLYGVVGHMSADMHRSIESYGWYKWVFLKNWQANLIGPSVWKGP